MNAATETLNKAREFSTGIAEWIDAQRAAGRLDHDIAAALKAATDLAKFERKRIGEDNEAFRRDMKDAGRGHLLR
jgi:hypothetical protein